MPAVDGTQLRSREGVPCSSCFWRVLDVGAPRAASVTPCSRRGQCRVCGQCRGRCGTLIVWTLRLQILLSSFFLKYSEFPCNLKLHKILSDFYVISCFGICILLFPINVTIALPLSVVRTRLGYSENALKIDNFLGLYIDYLYA